MNARPIVLAVLEALEHFSVPYMVVGSFSSNVYGIPRSTKDADFVVQLEQTGIGAIGERLGPDFQLEAQMSFETITGTSRHRIRHPSSTFMIELFLLSNDPHDRERFARRTRLPVEGREAFVPTPEDVVITKLRWSRQGRRQKDIADAESVIAVQRNQLDWDYLNRWCDAHGTRTLLDDIRASLPPL